MSTRNLTPHEIQAIRWQLRCMADDLTIGCNDHVNHGPQGHNAPDEARRFQLSDYLSDSLIEWVLSDD